MMSIMLMLEEVRLMLKNTRQVISVIGHERVHEPQIK